MSKEPFSLYFHVPFCAQKCPYCDFNTYATPQVPESAYIEALVGELGSYGEDPRFAGRDVATIFFGGGTPSLLSAAGIARIIGAVKEVFSIRQTAEITLEANPSRVGILDWEGFKQAGVNRISFGVQSFSGELLQALGRDHSAQDAQESVSAAVRAGINNISLDLMYGVPNQTLEDVERDLQVALKLPIKHISAYALSVEPGTPFFQRQERGLLAVPADSDVAEMMDLIPEVLGAQSFQRYEISNYALAGFESTHNTVYWTGGDYLGIGAGAHSYCKVFVEGKLVEAERWSTLANPQSYMTAVVESAGAKRPVSWREQLSLDEMSFEFFYLGLRRTCGVTTSDFKERFGCSWDGAYGKILGELASEGFLACTSQGIALTNMGIKLSDSVFERLVDGRSAWESFTR